MRIIFLGNPYSKHNGLRNFFYATRFYHGLVRCGHMVHYYADRDIAKQSSPLAGLLKNAGRQESNEKFLETVDNFKPEAIIFAHTGIITAETMAEVRGKYPEIRIAYLNLDALFSPKNAQNFAQMQQYCDAIFTTTGGEILKQHTTKSCSFHFMPNITDSSIDVGRAFEHEQPEFDVASFMHGEHNSATDQKNRLSLAKQVAEIYNIKVFYRGFDDYPPVYGVDYFSALGNSAMTLCLNRDSYDGIQSTAKNRYMYSSDRTAHAMGNGSLAIMSTNFNLDKLYNDDEVVFFSTSEELIEKVTFYKNNPAARQKIAKKGWNKAHQDFNEQIVMQYVIEQLFNQQFSQEYSWLA